MDSIQSTRIADLPDPFTSSNSFQAPIRQDDITSMHVHPNPYGIPQQMNVAMPMPVPQPPSQNQSQPFPPPVSLGSPHLQNPYSTPTLSPEQLSMLQQMPQQKLPSRDIPIDTTQYSQDTAIKPNYIPRPRRTDDYIEEYEIRTEKKMRQHEMEKEIDASNDHLFDRFQRPIMVALLFFIYSLPIVNTMVFKRLAFLAIFLEDGNLNIYGLLLKCILFGSTLWSIENGMKYLSEI